MKPCKSTNYYRYSPQWAQSVIRICYRKYARATEILWRYTGLSYDDAWHSLANNDEVWPKMRDCIHYIDRYCTNWGQDVAEGAIQRYTKQMLSTWRAKSYESWPQSADILLTDLREWSRINSQGFRGCWGVKAPRLPRKNPGCKPKEYYVRS